MFNNLSMTHVVHFLSFLMGLFSQWGTIDLCGIPLGLFWNRFTDKKFCLDLLTYLSNSSHLFILGIILSNVSVLRFVILFAIGAILSESQIDFDKIQKVVENGGDGKVHLYLNKVVKVVLDHLREFKWNMTKNDVNLRRRSKVGVEKMTGSASSDEEEN